MSKKELTKAEEIKIKTKRILRNGPAEEDFEYFAGLLGHDTALVLTEIFKDLSEVKKVLIKKKIMKNLGKVKHKDGRWTVV